MKDFIDEFIVTLSARQRRNVLDILGTAQIEKESLDKIAERLVSMRKSAPFLVSAERFNGLISAAKFDGVYQESFRRFRELFDVSNQVAILLDSHNAVLTSEIKALEDELNSIEKAIANYAFTLSDNGFYDYSFLETFADETMRETIALTLSDRSGTDFSNKELALVNSAAGILTLSPTLEISYPLTGNVLDSNCLGFTTSDTGIENALNSSPANGWRVAVSSPKPFSSSLSGIQRSGAQIKAEFYLSNPSPCDTILLTPFSDIPVEICQLILYSDYNPATSVATQILAAPQAIDRPTNFNFTQQSVARFCIVLNQGVFNRNVLPPKRYEEAHRGILSAVINHKHAYKKSFHLSAGYKKNNKALKRVFIKTQELSDPKYKLFRSVAPIPNFNSTSGALNLDRMRFGPHGYSGYAGMWRFETHTHNHMRRMIHESIFSSNGSVLSSRSLYSGNYNLQVFNTNMEYQLMSGFSKQDTDVQVEPAPNFKYITDPYLSEAEYLLYNYDIGMRNIQVGSGNKIFRGVFISKPIPASTSSSEVKIKVAETNYDILDSPRDSTRVTSVEYSVSSKSNPGKEGDWIPILPIEVSMVVGERIFFEMSGVSYSRFEVQPNSAFALYKNGYVVSSDLYSFILGTDGQTIIGLRLPPNSFLNTDIFTVDYTPSAGQDLVNFHRRGFGQALLASAYDSNGAGETFSNSGNNQVVTLIYDPFVDYHSVKSSGGYSSSKGFTGTYQPITIILEDGTVALNQTNYKGKGKRQNNLSEFTEDDYAYIHSGRNIIFNQPITDKFTVYYQYIPSNLRFRVVMRVNSTDYVSPICDFVQIKAKTLKSDPKKVF